MARGETILAAILGAALAASPGASVQAKAADARAFVERIYARYPAKAGADATPDKVFLGLFDPDLRALIERDRRMAGGEVGFLDFDPICQCQDDAGLHPEIVSVREAGPSAVAVVRNVFQAPDPPILVTYRLHRALGRWRIEDIQTDDTPSLRDWLTKALKGAQP